MGFFLLPRGEEKKTNPAPAARGWGGVPNPKPQQLTHAPTPASNTRPTRTRYFIPILSPRRPQLCPEGRKLAHICVSGIRGKSKPALSDWNTGQAIRVARPRLVY